MVLSEGPGTELPFGALAFLSVFPGLLNTAAVVCRGVICPDTQWVHYDFFFFYLIVKAPEYADDQVDKQVVQKLQTF